MTGDRNPFLLVSILTGGGSAQESTHGTLNPGQTLPGIRG